jgi:hypothetical protein
VMVIRERTYPAVERLHVYAYHHERKHYEPPHRYTYTEKRVISRPKEWPI